MESNGCSFDELTEEEKFLKPWLDSKKGWDERMDRTRTATERHGAMG